MEFTFDEKKTIEIDSKRYVCDPIDVNLIEGMSEHFPRIVEIGEEFKKLQKQMISKAGNAKKVKEISEKFFAKNRELLLECQGFIHGTLGVEEYNEIFAGRKPNSTEHLKLCIYIFNEVMKDRAALLQEYVDLPAPQLQTAASISDTNA